jgi:para-nitrobenzyl esterase
MAGAIVDTRSGKIQGLEADGIHVFRGIPFAKPPVGDLRWLPPQREEPWHDVRDATTFSDESAQAPFPMAALFGGKQPENSEDSLYLNVWTPGIDDARRPVMVWIHGGAFMNGSGTTPWYDGTRFAQHGDVVLVTINYRLASFGFLHLRELFGDEFEGSGNAGILDQVAALEWVRDNIEAFGGDPNQVTIFGESAGGGSVGTLLGMPRARGLFNAAIPQSGAASWWSSAARATDVAGRVVEALGAKPGDVAALRAKSTEEVLAAQAIAGLDVRSLDSDGGAAGLGLPFQPVVDGSALPQAPLDAINDGNADGVRLLVGTNRHEMTLFHLMDQSLAQIDEAGIVSRSRLWFDAKRAAEIVEGYRANRPDGSLLDVWTDLSTDAVFRIPAIRLAEEQLGHGPVWMYLFTWETPVFGGLRSTHALEIPFVFDALDKRGSDMFTGQGPERQRIADAMHWAWIAFARGQSPQHDGVPEWPQYDTKRRATMRFDATPELLEDPAGADRELWDGFRH